MVRYIGDDARIARHCGVTVEEVQAARAKCHDTHDNRMIARSYPPAPKAEILHAAAETWARDARQATEALAEALSRYRGRGAMGKPSRDKGNRFERELLQ